MPDAMQMLQRSGLSEALVGYAHSGKPLLGSVSGCNSSWPKEPNSNAIKDWAS